MGTDKVEIIEIRFMDDGRPLKAFVDVQIRKWIIRDFRVLQHNDQKFVVSPPQASWFDPMTRQIRFKTILTIPPEDKQIVESEILYSYQVEKEKRNA